MEELKKGPWSEEEDRLLSLYVEKYGAKNWGTIQSKSLLKRTGKSCEFRWRNRLRPGIRNDKFTPEEEQLLVSLQKQYGNKWAKIASYFAGRTDNQVKNFWNNWHKKMARAQQAMCEITNNHMPNDNKVAEEVNSGTSAVGPSSQTEPNDVILIESPCNNLSHELSIDDFIFDVPQFGDFIFDVPLHNNVVPEVLKEQKQESSASMAVAATPPQQNDNASIITEPPYDNPFFELSVEDYMVADINEINYSDGMAHNEIVVQEPQATAVSSMPQLGVPGPLHKPPPCDDPIIHDSAVAVEEARSRDNIDLFDPFSSLRDPAVNLLPDPFFGDQFLSVPSDEQDLDLRLCGDGSDDLF